ncbi:MAG: tRNA lysidine(34) synthetase TilS [Fimbriimonadales bacterium]|nr:MAG: tRNA(Ile)-lysidine synthase [Fimbriimonadales bacterium]
MEILERVRATLRERRLLPPDGGLVIVGYSGGADSTALLHLLTRLQDEFHIHLHAAHLHHGMRPEADNDVRVCQSVCEQLQVPLHIERVDVPARAQAARISLEEAGRNARYEFFERLAHALDAVAVALAHTRDDQMETILINLLRGTGPRGLCGMPYQRDRIIRPLLDATRAQTHAYCAAHGLPTVFDSTNLDPHQLRRRVRMELLPLMRDLSPAIDRHLLRLADILAQEESWWATALECGIVAAETSLQHSTLARDAFTQLHPALQRRVLREWLRRRLGALNLPPYEILEGVRRAVLDGRRTSWQLTDALRLTTDETALRLHEASPSPEPYEYPVVLETPVLIPQAGAWLEARLQNAPPPSLEPASYEAYLDADAVQGHLCVRNGRTGERFQPLGMHAPRKLSDIFIDRKIPRAERWRLPLLCDAAGILWIPGYTIAARARITPDTRRVLHVALRRNGTEA